MSIRTHARQTYLGTAAERGGTTPDAEAVGVRWFETDTGDEYLWTGSAWKKNGAMSLIESYIAPGAVASITFSGIPATYTHLQLSGIVRITLAGTGGWVGIRFNFGTTGAFGFTKLVDPIPNRALSISEAFLESILLL